MLMNIDRELLDDLTGLQEDVAASFTDENMMSGEVYWIVDKGIRDTQIIEFGDLYPKIEDLFKNIVKNIINPFYNAEVRDSEVPQFLRYGVGGHYAPHIDGRSIWVAPNGDKIWRRSTCRDLSIVLFLNDEFEGGEFVFPDLHIQVKPKPGLLVCFPSDQNYLHGVNSVKSGERYSIVSWARIKGQKTKEEEDQELLETYGVN
jgi:predicted 2-oxoglutarate/Fe(II)-dependent dioxygenase YbiX